MIPYLAHTLAELNAAAEEISPYIRETPVVRWSPLAGQLDADVWLKLELLQHSGTFKARGAILNILRSSADARSRGVTAVSAGNHAVAVAYAASRLMVDAKVVMPSSANPARVASARAFGADVLFAVDGPSAFELAERLRREEGRVFIHPFEGQGVALGTGTLGLELTRQLPTLDAVVVAVGGGGLAGGMAAAIHQIWPSCEVLGVEPAGADVMSRSFAAGVPQKLDSVATIADSLAPPFALPYSFALCREGLADILTIDDTAMQRAMAILFADAKLVTEPAGAAALAAAIGPYRRRLEGRRVGVIVCGGNIDLESFARHVRAGANGGDQAPAGSPGSGVR